METWATHAGPCLETVSRLGGESRRGEHEVRCAWIRRTRRLTTATPLNTHLTWTRCRGPGGVCGGQHEVGGVPQGPGSRCLQLQHP